jgi:hypothetical protein
MAKSTRSKVKRSFRRVKRETGVYAAKDAARVQRLSNKLKATATGIDEDGDVVITNQTEDVNSELEPTATNPSEVAEVAIEGTEEASTTSENTKISTHGPRGSRREQWRLSKGMNARPARNGQNRQGGVAAGRKAGRAKRRR